MSFMPFDRADYKCELEAAINVVERACCLCTSVRDSMSIGKGQLNKSDHSPVTIADFGVQSLVSMELGFFFPSITLVGEEDATYLRSELTEIEENNSTYKTPLVDIVANAVSKVALPEVRPVTRHTVLDAIDRGCGAFSSKTPSSNENSTYWVLDPIDGTRGFLEGGDALYVVGLSLVVKGILVLGVMGCPCLRESNLRFSSTGHRLLHSFSTIMASGKVQSFAKDGVIMAAHNGCGCWVKPLDFGSSLMKQKLNSRSSLQDFVQSSVNRCDIINDACFALSRHEDWDSYPLAHLVPSCSLIDSEDFQKSIIFLCCGSLCKYFAVAIGAVSVVLLPQNGKEHVKVWDHSAGVICVLEAGGQVTDNKGSDIEMLLCKGGRTFVCNGGTIVVTNSHLHGKILEALLCDHS